MNLCLRYLNGRTFVPDIRDKELISFHSFDVDDCRILYATVDIVSHARC
jgi:hypothetical protein